MTAWRILSVLFLSALVWLAAPPEAAASNRTGATQCTNSSSFSTTVPGGEGMVTKIAQNVEDELKNLAKAIFEAIEKAPDYNQIIGAVMTVYIALYGLIFALGMARYTAFDFVMRLIKIFFILLFIQYDLWEAFNNTIVRFFQAMIDQTINEVTKIAIGIVPPIGSESAALSVLDAAVHKVLSAKMIAHLMATATTSAYGIVYSILLVIAMWSFVNAILTAVWVYLMSMVLRAVLFGLAPIFFICILFERTKPLFFGWLNQIISACLQPILLFTFLSFFIVLVNTSIDSILTVPVCWTDMTDTMRAAVTTDTSNWRFMCKAGGGFQICNKLGDWEYEFPIEITAILIFFILSDLCSRFNHIVLMIAKDIAVGATDLASMSGQIGSLFSPGGGGAKPGGTDAAGARVNPDGTRGSPETGGGNGSPTQAAQPGGLVGALRQGLSSMVSRK